MKEVLHITTQTINARTKWYRNLIVMVVAVSLTSISWAVIQMSWKPLLGLIFIVPLCGVFLYLDSRFVNLWQERILQRWVQGDLDLTIFYNSMSTIQMFPQRMFQGMLKTLPINPDQVTSRNMRQDIRKPLALTLQTLNHCQNDRTIFTSLTYTLALLSVAMTMISTSWTPLLGLFLAPLVIIVRIWFRTVRLKRLRNHLIEVKRDKIEEFNHFIESAVHLDWDCIPKKKKVQLLSP